MEIAQRKKSNFLSLKKGFWRGFFAFFEKIAIIFTCRWENFVFSRRRRGGSFFGGIFRVFFLRLPRVFFAFSLLNFHAKSMRFRRKISVFGRKNEVPCPPKEIFLINFYGVFAFFGCFSYTFCPPKFSFFTKKSLVFFFLFTRFFSYII